MVSTLELAVRIGGFLVVLVGAPLFFVLLFRGLDYLAMDGLIEEYGENNRPTDRGRLDAHYRARDDALICPRCGAANGEGFAYCHTCQADLEVLDP